MMTVHQDATLRILHRSTHLDDALWAFAPSFRTAEYQSLLDPERWGGDGRSPFGSWASPGRRRTCAPAETGVGVHAHLACGHRSATVATRRSGRVSLGRATAGSHRQATANDPR